MTNREKAESFLRSEGLVTVLSDQRDSAAALVALLDQSESDAIERCAKVLDDKVAHWPPFDGVRGELVKLAAKIRTLKPRDGG